ncbi:MAG: glycosyltransferase family 39 protein [Gemmatimonadota bacterium]
MSYVGAAVSLAHGQGLRIPFAPWNSTDSTSHLKAFPPGYSLLLSIPIRFGADALQSGRVIQAVAAAVTVTVVATLAMQLAGPWAALLAALLLVMTPALVEDHLSILSEPLYLMLVALLLMLLLRRGESALVHGTVAALGLSVRYLGGSLVAAAVVWALLQGRDWPHRFKRAAMAALPAAILGALWILDARGGAGRPPASELIADWHLGGALGELREAVVLWLGPGPEDATWVTALALLSAMLGTLLLYRAVRQIEWPRWRTDSLPALWLAAAAIIVCHLGVLLFSRIFVGHEIPFDGRLLSPLIVVMELLFAVTLAGFWPTWGRAARAGVLIVLLLWLFGAQGWDRERMEDAHTNGWDYNGLVWRDSPTLAWARQASGRTLFTNHPVPVWFHAGRVSRDLPQSVAADSVAAFARALEAGHGAIVFLADTSWQPGVPLDSLIAAVPLRVVARFADGAIYERPLAVGH